MHSYLQEGGKDVCDWEMFTNTENIAYKKIVSLLKMK